MKNRKSRTLLTAVLAAALILVLGVPVLAALPSKNVTIYPGVDIYIDDQKLDPKDANGNPVEVFIYNGTTYLPVRAISNAFDKAIEWDGRTSSVYIGKHGGDQPTVWLSDLEYFDKGGDWSVGGTTKDNLGVQHEHSFKPKYDSWSAATDLFRTYKLNGQYQTLTGVFFQPYEFRTDTDYTNMSIYGDGKLLWSGKADHGVDPMEFSINVTGVLELKISMGRYSYGWYAHGQLGDVALWA